jgi:PTH1 family peptidyl-tRNA hydrolase
MRLIVGLGNPGKRYAETRHNLGFRVCDQLCERLATSWSGEKFSSRIAEARPTQGRVTLLEPQTFMNLSGQAVSAAVGFYRLELSEVLVICDDFNLPLGQLRLRTGGSHGGHNGLRSIVESLGAEEFPRLRLGVGPVAGMDTVDFCLAKFPPGEEAEVEEMVTRAADAAGVWLEAGIGEAMNRFNSKATQDG